MNRQYELRRALTDNVTSSGFTAKTAAILRGADDRGTAPNASAIKVNSADGPNGFTPTWVRLYPFGVGSDNDVFSMRIWGWLRIPGLPPTWVPTIIGEFSCTLSGFTGVAGGAVIATERFADTISAVATVGEYVKKAGASTDGSAWIYSPANDTPGCVEIPLRGMEYIEFDWDETTGTPTSNCLMQFLDEVPR